MLSCEWQWLGSTRQVCMGVPRCSMGHVPALVMPLEIPCAKAAVLPYAEA